MNEHPSAYQSLDLLTEEEFWDYARALANQTPTPPSAYSPEYLICELSQEAYVFPLSALYEVVPAPHRFARLPAMPAWMPGLVAWRGQTIAVVDLDAYLSGHSIAHPTEGTLLVANKGDITLGLLVSTIGKTTTDTEAIVSDMEGERPIFDMPAFFADVIEKIEVAASYG